MNEHIQDNIVSFHPQRRKGLGYEPPGGSNWLSELQHGTRFLAKLKSDSGSRLTDFIVTTDPRTMFPVLLGENINSREATFSWRDPELFSQDWKFYITIEVVNPDGNSDKVQEERMASDDRSEVTDQDDARK